MDAPTSSLREAPGSAERRPAGEIQEIYEFGPFRLEPAERKLVRGNEVVALTPKAFDTLHLLVRNSGHLVEKDELIRALWPSSFVEEGNLTTNIFLLRRALGPGSEYIETVSKKGYRFVGAVRRLPTAGLVRPDKPRDGESESAAEVSGAQRPPASLQPTQGPPPLAVPRPAAPPAGEPVFAPRWGKRVPITAIVLVALGASAYLFIGKAWISKHEALPSTPRMGPVSVAPAALAPPPHSIAVLPLVNESGEASQQYFSDGISEDLITALSQFPGLKVIGRTSAFQFRDSKEDSRGIGAKLGVAHLLEGTVRRSGEMVRVSAELIDTADGSTQWAERYDRPYKDLFALQDEITRAVVGALKAKLLPGEHAVAQSERPPSGSLEAYNAMLQGWFSYNRGTEADYRKAIGFFTQATELDPHYALAWSGLAEVWTSLGGGFLVGAAAQEAYAKARAAAARALALAPDLAHAHIARGFLLQLADFDWRGAEAEFRRALALTPNDPDAQAVLGGVLATYGELEPAIELTREALRVNPMDSGYYSWLAGYLSGLNRLDEAESTINRAIELQPAAAAQHYILTMIEVRRGNAQAARAAAQQEPPGFFQDAALALALQIGGDRTAADAALTMLIEKDATLYAYGIAQVYALRNDADRTFEWLDRTWRNRDVSIAYLLFDPFILRFKDDPRFAAFCRKVGLPAPGETVAHKSTYPGGSTSVR